MRVSDVCLPAARYAVGRSHLIGCDWMCRSSNASTDVIADRPESVLFRWCHATLCLAHLMRNARIASSTIYVRQSWRRCDVESPMFLFPRSSESVCLSVSRASFTRVALCTCLRSGPRVTPFWTRVNPSSSSHCDFDNDDDDQQLTSYSGPQLPGQCSCRPSFHCSLSGVTPFLES